MSNDEGMSKPPPSSGYGVAGEWRRSSHVIIVRYLNIRHSFELGHSDFVILQYARCRHVFSLMPVWFPRKNELESPRPDRLKAMRGRIALQSTSSEIDRECQLYFAPAFGVIHQRNRR